MRTPAMRTPQVPLAEMTAEQRNQLVTSAFALADFDIKVLSTAAEGESVKIPRPKKWLELMILSMSYVKAGPAQVKDEAATIDSRSGDSKLPSFGRSKKVKLTTITNLGYETDRTPKANVILVALRGISRDRYMAVNDV
jgi:hypothetical protein